MAKGIVSCFPMNKAEEMEKNAEKEEVNKEEEEAMQQSCTSGPWQLFPSSEQGVGEEEEQEEENKENEKITLQCSLTCNCFFQCTRGAGGEEGADVRGGGGGE